MVTPRDAIKILEEKVAKLEEKVHGKKVVKAPKKTEVKEEKKKEEEK